MKKVFFSWQSDNKPVRNKIRKALSYAIDEIGQELEPADRPELDSDTSGTFSSEDIMSTIFKKIDSATLFIADATPIAETEEKLIPNPNVMAEIGYALKVMKEHTKLFIFASDDPKAEEKMPFDIRAKKLFRIDMSKTPRQIAEDLKPYLEWMLEQTGSGATSVDEYPLIYATGATWQRWANAETVALNIRNANDKEYLLEAIELEGYSSEPMRALRQDSTTQGISITGPIQISDNANPVLKMTVSRGGVKYRLEQKLITAPRDDGRFNIHNFVESSTPVLY